ncbi:MAG: hypothetical protein ACRCSP_10135, partial [Rhodoglobus sp.]
EALGTEPTIEAGKDGPGNNGFPAGNNYVWDGFALQTFQNPDAPTQHEMTANFFEETLGDIRLVGPDGVSVNDQLSTLPPAIELGAYEGEPNEPRYLLGTSSNGDVYGDYVRALKGTAEGEIVVELIAPESGYGGPLDKLYRAE